MGETEWAGDMILNDLTSVGEKGWLPKFPRLRLQVKRLPLQARDTSLLI
jgi:hypothetical protein